MEFLRFVPDILICLIVAWSMINGYTRGFVRTLCHSLGWVLSLLLAFIFAPMVQNWFMINTPIYENIQAGLMKKIANSIPQAGSVIEGIPQALTKGFDNIAGVLTDNLATRTADIIFSILSFIIVIFLVKLTLWILTEFFSKKKRGSLTSLVDGSLGLIFGALSGAFIVLMILAILIPLLALSEESFSVFVLDLIDKSVLTKYFYYNNPIVIIFQGFLTKIL